MKHAVDLFPEPRERRRYPRKSLSITVFLKVGLYVQGVGSFKDISLRGVCLASPELFALIRPEQASMFEGAVVSIDLPDESLSVHGRIIRVDVMSRELGIVIEETSDSAKWKKLCS